VIAVRRAVPADAPAMSAVLIASITELCVADHHNDPELLAGWLANKTPEGVAAWFGNPDSVLLVAEGEGEIAAVGGYFAAGRRISLNYVSPHHRFIGVSKAMLAALEAGLGPGEAQLDSTATARRFYEACAWEVAGEPTTHRGIAGWPMRKVIG
jgi:hypothetical protein